MNSLSRHDMNTLEKMEMLVRLVGFKVRSSISRMVKLDKRYKIDQIESKHLEGNALGCPSRRNMRIYLPPGYFDSGDTRFPVIYMLHGYNSGHGNGPLLPVTS
jgi:hypothetical protein